MKQPLCVITNNPQEVFQRNVIEGVKAAAASRGYDALIITVPERRIPEQSFDGMAGAAGHRQSCARRLPAPLTRARDADLAGESPRGRPADSGGVAQ